MWKERFDIHRWIKAWFISSSWLSSVDLPITFSVLSPAVVMGKISWYLGWTHLKSTNIHEGRGGGKVRAKGSNRLGCNRAAWPGASEPDRGASNTPAICEVRPGVHFYMVTKLPFAVTRFSDPFCTGAPTPQTIPWDWGSRASPDLSVQWGEMSLFPQCPGRDVLTRLFGPS